MTKVLITGANQGLGYLLAKHIGSQPNFTILAAGRNAEKCQEAIKKLQSEGVKDVHFVQLDVTSSDSIAAAKSQVEKDHGHVDVFINNAGVSGIGGSKGTRETWRTVFETNTFGPAETTEAFLPLLEKSSNPRMIYMTSDLGSIATRLDPTYYAREVFFPAYNASKAALNMLMATYSMKYENKMSFNVYNPGYVATAFNGYSGSGDPAEAIKPLAEFVVSGKKDSGRFMDHSGKDKPW